MAGRRISVLGVSLALAFGVALSAVPAAAASAASPRSQAHQHAVCPAVGHGYARCLAHVVGTGQGHRSGPTSTTPHGYGPATIAKAYGFAVTGGTTQTIAIVDAYGAPTIATDLQSFSSEFGLPACPATNGCFTKVNQSGGTSYPRATSGWALEQSLDVEWAHSLAPHAKILLVEASSASFTNLLAAVRYASSQAHYVSMSWGGTETSNEGSYDSTYFSTSGVSYFAAAGDTGSQVIYPSSSPDVMSVGGTTLTVTSTGSWSGETGWSTAGGGCSTYEAANPAQQTDSTPLCGTHRATPDISLDANPSTGVAVYDTERLSTGQSGWIQVGGTSASTVMVAAHATETTQAVNASTVYGGTLKVYDVTAGSNGHACTTGYDLCTGVGSWNTAVGKSSGSSGGPAGALSFAPAGGQTLTAGSPSAAISVSLTTAQTKAVTITLTTSTGGFSATTSGLFASSMHVQVAAGTTSSTSFYYESTTAGTHTITASATGWTPTSQSETVHAATLATITVTPANATVTRGGTQTFSATGYDAHGNPVALTNVSWSVSPATLGSLVSSGSSTTFTAAATGTGKVSATTGTVSGTATVTVTAAAPLAATLAVARTSRHGPWYHTPITVAVSQGSSPVSGASVLLHVYGGPSCSTPVTTGTGTTGSSGSVTLTFKTRSAGTYCAVAVANYGSQSALSTEVTFTT